MSGPCLCGDSYCPHCGNPAEAARCDALEELCDKVIGLDMSQEEMEIFWKVGLAAVEAIRPALRDLSDVRASMQAMADADLMDIIEEDVN